MSRFSKYVREKVVKVLVAALVAGSVAGNEGITVQAAGADLNDPFSFVLYTNEFVSSNLDHIEGNAAIRELKVSMVSYGGKSYLGDLSAPNQILKYTASGRTDEKELVIPLTNSGLSYEKQLKEKQEYVRKNVGEFCKVLPTWEAVMS